MRVALFSCFDAIPDGCYGEAAEPKPPCTVPGIAGHVLRSLAWNVNSPACSQWATRRCRWRLSRRLKRIAERW